MKQTLKRRTPVFLWNSFSSLYWSWYNRGRHVLAKYYDPRWARSHQSLQRLKGFHQGQRCFIIGNGPSLRQTDLSLLKGEITFGLNRIYLLFPELGFKTTYLVSVNDLVLQQCASELSSLEVPKFITWRARNWFTKDSDIIYLDSDYTGEEVFAQDASGRIFEGFTVTYVALQLAYHMGFNEVVLVGVDHNFITQGPANTPIVSMGDDPNHFSPVYFGKGFTWQLPDLIGSERAYRLAKQAFDQDDRKILDATIGGKLSVFPKVDYLSLFADKMV